MWWREESETFKKIICIENFRENNTEALQFPYDDRTDANFIAPHFYRSKSALDILKSVFNVFWRRWSLGAPVLCIGV